MTSATAILEERFETLAERVDQSVSAVLGLEVDARDKAMMLKHAVEDFHQYALAHLIQHLKKDEHGRDLLFGMLDDPSIYALFAMHGLIRVDPKIQALQALESVRPYMQSHGGDVELVNVQDNVVYLKLQGACEGCSASSTTLNNLVEKVIRTQMPDVTQIVVVPTVAPGIVPLDAITIHAS